MASKNVYVVKWISSVGNFWTKCQILQIAGALEGSVFDDALFDDIPGSAGLSQGPIWSFNPIRAMVLYNAAQTRKDLDVSNAHGLECNIIQAFFKCSMNTAKCPKTGNISAIN